MLNTHQTDGDFNEVTIRGVLVDNPKFDHLVDDDHKGAIYYYSAVIKTPRKSGVDDYVPIVIEQKLRPNELRANDLIEVKGRIQTIITKDKRWRMFIRATSIKHCEDDSYINIVRVEGKISLMGILRQTPKTNRKIIDFKLAVSRPNGKRSYVPCIAWGDNAALVDRLKKGDKICVTARFQSREYQKLGRGERKRTFELSIQEVIIY